MGILKDLWNKLYSINPEVGLTPIRDVPPMPAVKPPREQSATYKITVDLASPDLVCPFNNDGYACNVAEACSSKNEGCDYGEIPDEFCPLRSGGVLVVADNRKENDEQ